MVYLKYRTLEGAIADIGSLKVSADGAKSSLEEAIKKEERKRREWFGVSIEKQEQ